MDGHEPIRRNALRLALELERLDGLHVDVVAHEAIRQVAEQYLLRARCLLEARGDVDGIAGDEPLAGRRVAGNDLAGVHPGADREPNAPLPLELVVQHILRAPHARGGAHSAQRVVLVELGQPEDGHDRVPDELLDDAAVALELGAHRVEVARHHLAQRLGVELLAHRSRALQVGKHDGHDLAELLGWRRGREG